MVEIIKYDDFPYSSRYKQKHNQSSFYELLGNIFSKELKEQLWNLYKELNVRVSYNEYLEDLIEEVKLLNPRVASIPYVPRYTYDTDEAFQMRVEFNNLQHESWFREVKINKIQEIKTLIKPMNNPYSQLSKFLNTSSYLPFELYFEDIFEKGNTNNLSFVEFFDKLIKENKTQYKSTITKTKSDIIAEEDATHDKITKTKEERIKDIAEKTLPKLNFEKNNISDLDKCHRYTNDYEYLVYQFDNRTEYHVLCPNTHKDDINVYFSKDGLYVEKYNIKQPYPFQPKFNKLFLGNYERFDREKITSELKNGVLLINVPYKQVQEDFIINIKVN